MSKKGTVPFFWALISGILTALCLPRSGLCFLGWFSFAPLFWACKKFSLKKTFALGWIAGFSFHAFALFWIYQTCRFAAINPAVAVFAWMSLALFLGLNWGLICASSSFAAKGLCAAFKPWAWAFFWAAWEVLWLKTPRLCMDIPSYVQYRHLSLIQIDGVFGPQGLGFLVIAFNAALADGISFLTTPPYSLSGVRKSFFINIALCGFLILGVWAYGRNSLSKADSKGESFKARILQPNIDQYQKWESNAAGDILANFKDLLSHKTPRPPDLIIWPEAAWPITVQESAPPAEQWMVDRNAAQIVGVVVQNRDRFYNAAEYIAPNGTTAGFYFKRELVPFGEYVPWDFARRFIGYLDQLGNLTPGPALPVLFETKFGKIGCTICYEAVFPELSRIEAQRGARIIANITNDGWYKETWGPYQHFHINVFRAVENRVYVLRAANTGISAVIDPWGRIIKRLPLNVRGRLDALIPREDPFPQRSFYARHGDWFGVLCLIAACLSVLWRVREIGTGRTLSYGFWKRHFLALSLGRSAEHFQQALRHAFARKAVPNS